MNNTIAIMRYMQNLDALAAAVSAEMQRQKLNTYEVADRARKKGYKVVHGTVWNVINCNVKEVKDKTIVAIAHGLNLPEQTLFSIVRGKTPGETALRNERFVRLAEKYEQLSEEDKDKIDPFLKALEETIERVLPNKSVESGVSNNRELLSKYFVEDSEKENDSEFKEIKKPSRRKAS